MDSATAVIYIYTIKLHIYSYIRIYWLSTATSYTVRTAAIPLHKTHAHTNLNAFYAIICEKFRVPLQK